MAVPTLPMPNIAMVSLLISFAFIVKIIKASQIQPEGLTLHIYVFDRSVSVHLVWIQADENLIPHIIADSQ